MKLPIADGSLHARIAADVPKIKRGKVWCLTCGAERDVDGAECLAKGWPTCCGRTMTIDHPMERLLRDAGYEPVRQLPTGEWAGLADMFFTTALCVGLDETGYRTRFCFETRGEAEEALRAWDGKGLPPGWWVKEKGPQGDRPNPRRRSDPEGMTWD